MRYDAYNQNYDLVKNKILKGIDESYLIPVEFDKREYIAHEGDDLFSIIFILEGKTKIYQNYENGKTLLLRIYDDFTIIGDIEYFLKETATCSVETLSNVRGVKVSFDYLNKFFRRNVDFLDNMLLEISEKILLSSKYASLNLMYPLDTRLASYLLSMKSTNSNKVLLPKLTDLANQIGTSYRHLERRLKKLEDDLVISRDNKVVYINDEDKLYEIGRGNIYEREDEKFVKGK